MSHIYVFSVEDKATPGMIAKAGHALGGIIWKVVDVPRPDRKIYPSEIEKAIIRITAKRPRQKRTLPPPAATA